MNAYDDLSRALAHVNRQTIIAQRQQEQAEGELTSLIYDARVAGASWAQIAKELGVSKQAAQKRYGPVMAVWGVF